MWVFWVILAALLYFGLLGAILVFLAAASQMSRHWGRVFRETHTRGEDWRRAA